MQPVAYHLDDEEIVFRTKNGSKLAAATRHAVVGFEVDDFDLEARTGWSVLGVGEAYEIVDPARLAALADTHTDPWVPGPMPTRSRFHCSSSPVDASSPIPNGSDSTWHHSQPVSRPAGGPPRSSLPIACAPRCRRGRPGSRPEATVDPVEMAAATELRLQTVSRGRSRARIPDIESIECLRRSSTTPKARHAPVPRWKTWSDRSADRTLTGDRERGRLRARDRSRGTLGVLAARRS